MRVVAASKKRVRCKRDKIAGRVKVTCRRRRKHKVSLPVGQTPVKTPVKPPVQQPTKPPAKPTVPQPPATPVPLAPASLLSSPDRHLVSRFSYGVDRRPADQGAAAGGGAAWFEAQLGDCPGPSDPATDDLLDWWPSLRRCSPRPLRQATSGAELGQ